MTNILDFSQLIGVEEKIHKATINGRTILYSDPTLESLPAISKMQETGGSFGSVYDAALKVFRGQTFEDGEPFSEAWLEDVSLGEFMFFVQFMSSPSHKSKPAYAEPLTLKNFKGYDIVLPPVTLGNIKAFNGYLNGEQSRTQQEWLVEQIGVAFDKATLADGSPVPENLMASLTPKQAEALMSHWMNGPAQAEVQSIKKASPTSGKRKTAAGTKRSRSSSKSTASAPSQESTDTSGS